MYCCENLNMDNSWKWFFKFYIFGEYFLFIYIFEIIEKFLYSK